LDAAIALADLPARQLAIATQTLAAAIALHRLALSPAGYCNAGASRRGKSLPLSSRKSVIFRLPQWGGARERRAARRALQGDGAPCRNGRF